MFEALPQNCLFNLGAADLSALLYAGHEAAIHIEIVATCAKRVANLRVSRRLSPEGGGMGPPCPPPRSAPGSLTLQYMFSALVCVIYEIQPPKVKALNEWLYLQNYKI